MTPAKVEDFVRDEVVVTFPMAARPSTDPQSVIRAVAQDYNLSILSEDLNQLLSLRIVRFSTRPLPESRSGARNPLDGRPVPEIVTILNADPRTIQVQPNFIFQLASGASSREYAVGKLEIMQARRLSNGAGVPIAVIDSGVDIAHPTLRDINVEVSGPDGTSTPAGNHGTAVVGIIAAKAVLTGVAPNTRILSFGAFDESADNRKIPWKSTTTKVLQGIDWSVQKHARVLNLSFTGPFDDLLGRALEVAGGRGVIAVAAAGNLGARAKPVYPAAYPVVIAVTATDKNDKLYRHANHGGYIELAAPGVDILVAAPDKTYGLMSGTSMATAFVSGTISLMMKHDPHLSGGNILTHLAETSRDLGKPGKDAEYGYGLINAYAALQVDEKRSNGPNVSGERRAGVSTPLRQPAPMPAR